MRYCVRASTTSFLSLRNVRNSWSIYSISVSHQMVESIFELVGLVAHAALCTSHDYILFIIEEF